MSRITLLEDEIHELKVKLEKAKFKTADRERYIGKLNKTIVKDRETLAFYAEKVREIYDAALERDAQ